ncbi:MAG: lyso-ornithine lipid acyltransferase [Rhodocyclaceae bacterium]|nr:lyso-ornithine lipid acyltransferase [Rhodocyclaceae bacterium]
MATLLLRGVATVALAYPFCNDAWRLELKHRWSRDMLDILGVRLEADLSHLVPGSMVVANHISWLDIFIINAALPAAFVAKEEVRHWPLLGWLAAANDTVFLRRGSRGHARIINQEIAGLLAAGKPVAVFPEGTTTDGTHLLHFHAALLQPALAAGRPVVPVAISYWEPDGSRSLAPRYDGPITLGQSLAAILSRRRLVARLVTTPALGGQGLDRRTVATAARAAISAAAALPPPSNPPGKPAGLPGAGPSDARPTGTPSREPEDSAVI